MLHRVLLAAASVVAFTAAANAADMYRAAPSYKDVPYVGVNWSGLYAGINGGVAWNNDTNSSSVGLFGGQIGYNIQRGNIVFGVEADIDGAEKNFDYLGTVRGRVGYAIDRALVYGTGGFAYAGNKDATPSTTADGWVAGGGVEYKFTPSWSVKGEYQHVELTSVTPTETAETFRIGVNYFVGGGYDPLK
jgi:outer membrane immunogenic protein